MPSEPQDGGFIQGRVREAADGLRGRPEDREAERAKMREALRREQQAKQGKTKTEEH